MPVELSKEEKEKAEEKSISEDEVSDCISEKIDEGWDRDRAVAACLNMAEEGSSQPEKEVDTMNPEEHEERVKDIQEHEQEMKTARFQITGKDVDIVKESQDSDGEIVVNVPIQALSEDRDGDFINEQGQESIIRQLSSGTVPLMLNHGIGSNPAMYDARDIIGQFIDGDNRNGTTIGTARMRMNKEGEELHSDAKEVVDLLEQDMPIGFSVGFIPQEYDEKENGGMEISDLDLMEVSAVGIPSNPEAVPQAMGSAVAMAKNAGLSKNEIMQTVRKSFEDTMTEKDGQSEKDDAQSQNEDSKSEEQEKQFSDDEIQEILGVVGGALEAHMDEAMQQIEEELEMEEDEETEEDEMDEEEEEEEDTVETDEQDEDEEDDEEMNQDPEKDTSDNTEDEEKSSSESEDNSSEVLSEDEKTVDEEKDGEQRLTTSEENDEKSGEDESEIDYDPRMAV